VYRRKLSTLLVALACGLATLPITGGPAHAVKPLPPPGKPVASDITTSGATLTWPRQDGPVFRYSMQQFVNGQWQGYASMPFNTFKVGGLSPDTEYTFAVQAHALVGSGYTSSPLSEPVTFRTLASTPVSGTPSPVP
jgi:hypothetical protein